MPGIEIIGDDGAELIVEMTLSDVRDCSCRYTMMQML